jgi:hypothetical protein
MEKNMPNSRSLSPGTDPGAVARRLIQNTHTLGGLPEIAVGLTFLLTSGLLHEVVALPRGSIGFKAAVLILSLFIPFLICVSPWALRWVRRRYLIERVGYVQSKPIGRKLIVRGILLAVLTAVVLFGIVPRLPQPDSWLLAGAGLLGGGLQTWCGRIPRAVILGVLMAVTGVFLAFCRIPLEAGFAILFGFQGLVTLISGGVVFLRFIRQPVETGA